MLLKTKIDDVIVKRYPIFMISQVGFEMVDAIAEAEGISLSKMQFKALFGKGTL